MDAELTSPPTTSEESTTLPHQPFQAAHEVYFRDLDAIWNEAQQRIQDVHFEYQRALQQAWQSQAQKDLQDAHENFQSSFQKVSTDPAPTQRYAEAYRKYKGALQEAMIGLNLDELDPQTLAAIGQSMLVVAQSASQLNWSSQTKAPEE